MHQAVAKKLTLSLQPSLSSQELDKAVSEFIRGLADELNIKGIIPGHIKVLIAEGDAYAAFSCTKPGKITRQTSQSWADSTFHAPTFSYNVIVFDIPMEKVNNEVKKQLLKNPAFMYSL